MQLGKKEKVEEFAIAVLDGHEKYDENNTMMTSEIYRIAKEAFDEEMANIDLESFRNILWIISKQINSRIVKCVNNGGYYVLTEEQLKNYIGM